LNKIEKLLKNKSGIRLDIGAGENGQPGFVTLDKRKLPNVDLVWDLERFPYPLPDECCLTIIGSHIVEHIKPWLMIEFMDELWRIMKIGGQLAFVHPYGVNSLFVQDPTHCNPCNAATWQYYDPSYPLYDVYSPSPWRIEKGFPVWQQSGVMEVIFCKMTESEAKKRIEERRINGKP